MITITIPKREYERLKQHSSAYLRIAEEMVKAERVYPYDYQYIDRLIQEAKKEKWIEAKSIDEALVKMKRK